MNVKSLFKNAGDVTMEICKHYSGPIMTGVGLVFIGAGAFELAKKAEDAVQATNAHATKKAKLGKMEKLGVVVPVYKTAIGELVLGGGLVIAGQYDSFTKAAVATAALATITNQKTVADSIKSHALDLVGIEEKSKDSKGTVVINNSKSDLPKTMYDEQKVWMMEPESGNVLYLTPKELRMIVGELNTALLPDEPVSLNTFFEHAELYDDHAEYVRPKWGERMKWDCNVQGAISYELKLHETFDNVPYYEIVWDAAPDEF